MSGYELPPVLKPEWMTDAILAARFEVERENVLRYSPVLGWFVWDGRVWKSASKEAAFWEVRRWLNILDNDLRHAAAAYAELGDEGKQSADYYTSVYKMFSRKYGNATAVNRLLVEISANNRIRVEDPTEFDAHPDLLNTLNGVVDLRTGDLTKHDPALLMTRIAGAAYVPGATHPDWTAALEAFGDLSADARGWVQRFLGSGCSGHTLSDSLSVFLTGNGSNGKSGIVGGIDTALGSYSGTVPVAAIEAGNGYETAVAMLNFRGLRFALLEETSEETRLATTAVKRLSSGNEVNARMLGKGNVTFKASHTLAIATNHEPYVKESDKGTWRRLVMVRFDKTFDLLPTFDHTLRDRIVDGEDGRAEAVLAWLIAGCRAWYDSGRRLTPLPAELQNATNEWREDTDLLGQFFNSGHIVFSGEPTHFAANSDIYTMFETWCVLSGNRNPYSSQRGFTQAFKSHEYVHRNGDIRAHKSDGVRGWVGITATSALVP